MMLKIGNASAFWGDSPRAPFQLMQQQPDLDFLTLDYLAELTLSIMAIQRDKDPRLGYAHDFPEVIRSLVPCWQGGSKVKVLTNAGGLNPLACAEACVQILKENNLDLKVGVVTGDDVLAHLRQNPSEPLFHNLDTSDPLSTVQEKLQTANAYLGAKPLVAALAEGADIVIAGRVADVSLTVAPCVQHFGWKWDDYDALAGATVAGHLIECGTQVTGGASTNWLEIPRVEEMGYPFVEIHEEGAFTLTKPKHSGGVVNKETVKEQLLYEMGDPENFLTPDVIVSLASLTLQEEGENRIYISHASGKALPDTYKVSATYRDGYQTEGQLTFFGQHAHIKAKRSAEVILHRLRQMGHSIERSHIEVLGNCNVVPGVVMDPFESDRLECVLRLSLASQTKEPLESFSKEWASLVTCGPQGVTGYATGRPKIRPIFAFWPCLISADIVKPQVEVF